MGIAAGIEEACVPHWSACVWLLAWASDSRFLLMQVLGGNKRWTQVRPFLKPLWETWTEFPASRLQPSPGLGVARIWEVNPNGSTQELTHLLLLSPYQTNT